MISRKKNKKEEIEILEFDEDKKQSKFKEFKVFLSDKRNKALVKLGIYFVFIIFVVIYVRVLNDRNQRIARTSTQNNNNVTEILPDTITDKVKILKDNKDYQFIITYEIDDGNTNTYIISGKKENDIISIDVNSRIYYLDNNLNRFYEEIDENKNYIDDSLMNNLYFYLSDNIYNYLLKADYQFKKEDNSGNTIINSLIKIPDFAYINHNILDNENTIMIETTENDTNDLNVFLDMTNYYMYDGLISYHVTIEFKY